MALIKGEDLKTQQVQQGSGEVDLSQYGDPEERRMIERGLIELKIRRWFRIIALVCFVGMFVTLLSEGNGLMYSLFVAAAVCGIGYVLCLYFYVYILFDKAAMLYFFLRDLFTKKDTRL